MTQSKTNVIHIFICNKFNQNIFDKTLYQKILSKQNDYT